MEDPVRILFVDDEPNILRALKRLFIDEEYEIQVCNSGPEGLRMLERLGCVHVVVSDFRMPGMNGVELLREVADRWPETVRIILSGYADTAAITADITRGQIFQYVSKPWDDNELKITVSNAVDYYYTQKKKNDHIEGELATCESSLRNARELLDALPFAVLGLRADGKVSYGNVACAQLLEKRITELASGSRQEILAPEINRFLDDMGPSREGAGLATIGGERHAFRVHPMNGKPGVVIVFFPESKAG